MEEKIDQIISALESLNSKFDDFDSRLSEITRESEYRIRKIEEKVDEINGGMKDVNK